MIPTMTVDMRAADNRGEVLRCQDLIASIYRPQYGVTFSADSFDLEAKIESWPHAYLFGTWRGDLVCTAGLYLRNTYVERFGDVAIAIIDDQLVRMSATGYSSSRLREVTKVVVAPEYRGRGLGRILVAAAHSKAFLQQDTPHPALSIGCARLSIYRRVFDAVLRSHRLKDFPSYPAHEKYRSPQDPMESRLIIPTLDVPREYYEHPLPGTYQAWREDVPA